MPLPQPNKETHKKMEDWMPVCMANPTMNKEFPDKSQRYAVCVQQWKTKGSFGEFIDWLKSKLKNR